MRTPSDYGPFFNTGYDTRNDYRHKTPEASNYMNGLSSLSRTLSLTSPALDFKPLFRALAPSLEAIVTPDNRVIPLTPSVWETHWYAVCS